VGIDGDANIPSQKAPSTGGPPAVFLDRDGTLNRDFGYIYRHEDWEWLPGALEAIGLLNQAGLKLVVVTNQSGIARGMFTESDLAHLHREVGDSLKGMGLSIDGWYHCPHHPSFTGDCACRKPAPGLLTRAASDLGLDLKASYLLGDKFSDVEAGVNAGLRLSVLIHPPGAQHPGALPPGVAVAGDVLAAAKLVLEDFSLVGTS
jgi:D-glycero-D-manno-heptose 1,7-bisphosphate phosphatase